MNVFAMTLAGIALVLLALNTVMDVVMREFTSAGMPATLELVSYWWMPWLTFFALTVAEFGDEHIRIGALTDGLHGRMRLVSDVVAGLIAVALVAWMSVLAIQKAFASWEIGDSASVNRWLPIWPVHIAVAVGLVLYTITLAAKLGQRVLGARIGSAGAGHENG